MPFLRPHKAGFQETDGFARWSFAAAVLAVLVLVGCGPDPLYYQLKVALDTPVHHLANGFKLMANEKYEPARREFERARELDATNHDAYIGLGLLSGWEGRYVEGRVHLERARVLAKSPEERAEVDLAEMRLLTLGQDRIAPDWLARVEAHYKKVIAVLPESKEARLRMGLALKSAFHLSEAAVYFSRVLDLTVGFKREEIRWHLTAIHILQLAYPVSPAGKTIALKEGLTRLDLAVLLNREMDLAALANGDLPGVRLTDDPALFDPYIQDVRRIVSLSIDGLSADKEGRFHPRGIVTRVDLARVLAHILVKHLGDPGIVTRYTGVDSPFSDVPRDVPYYNAVMLVTQRELMTLRREAGAEGTREFRPTDTVSGADAMMGIRALQHQIAVR